MAEVAVEPAVGSAPHAAPLDARWALPVLALLAGVVFVRTTGFGLVWDDPRLLGVLDEQLIQSGLAGLLASDFRLDSTVPLGFYRPVTMLTLWVDRAVGGGAAWTFHATNVLLHVAATMLLFGVLRRLGLTRPVALAGGALFAVHPVHVESVAFVSGRTDLLAAVFSIGAVLLWLRARSADERSRASSVAAGGALYLLACLSKEVALVLPAVLVAWDLLLPSASARWRARDRFAWLAAFATALGAVLVLRSLVAGVPAAGGIAGLTGPMPVAQRLAQLPSVLLFSLRLLAFPWPLTPYYVPDQIRVGAATLVAAGLLLAAWVLLAGRRWKQAGALSAAWTLMFLLPALPLVERGGALVAERFLYLPSAGLSMLVVAWPGRGMPFRRPLGVLFALAAAVAALITVRESAIWRDEDTLISAITRRSPTWADGWVGLAHVREQQGRLDEAAALLDEALRLDPAHEGAHMKLGMVRGRQGRFDQALTAFRRALELRPDYPDALVSLGQTLLMMRRPFDAIPPLERTVALRPSFGAAWTLLGRARGMTGDHAGAGDAFGRAVAIAPADTDAWFGLVVAQLRLGHPDLAWEAQRALARVDAEAGQRALALIRSAGG